VGNRSAGLVLALVGLAVFAEACRHRVFATVDPPHAQQWILPDRADDGEPFCVPSAFGGGATLAEAFPLRCTTVADVRRYVRGQRSADE
jgi:hypothetical protein